MARPKSAGETKSHQQHLLMTPSEVQAIDDWRFKNRIGSRGEAIRRLCQNGLTVHEDIELALDEASDIWDNVTEDSHTLWTIMMQVRNRHEYANPKLPAREWTAEEVVDRALDQMADLVDRCHVLYLDLLSLNNRVYTMSETGPFTSAQREARRQKEEIEAMRAEVLRRREEGEDNRRLGVVIHWMEAHPDKTEQYEAMTEDQKEEYLNRVTEHIKQVGIAALIFTDEERARVTRTNDEPFDLRALADFVAGQVLLSPQRSVPGHLNYVRLHMPTSDQTMVEIMVEKSIAAARGRNVEMSPQ